MSSTSRSFLFLRRRDLLVLTVAVLMLASRPMFQIATIVYEDASLALFPSAEQAAQYASRHFSSQNALLYDIDRAEELYRRALELDPASPTALHDLARIAFLRGRYLSAHAFIDGQIDLHGDLIPSSYYVRALIEGYMGRYDDAIVNYQRYLTYNPNNWAAINDYAWVLMKAGRFSEAAEATSKGLTFFPGNAWLLNSSAIANYEVGNIEMARAHARLAVEAAAAITEDEWVRAYPGNDPRTARAGIETLRRAAADNMHTISLRATAGDVQ